MLIHAKDFLHALLEPLDAPSREESNMASHSLNSPS